MLLPVRDKLTSEVTSAVLTSFRRSHKFLGFFSRVSELQECVSRHRCLKILFFFSLRPCSFLIPLISLSTRKMRRKYSVPKLLLQCFTVISLCNGDGVHVVEAKDVVSNLRNKSILGRLSSRLDFSGGSVKTARRRISLDHDHSAQDTGNSSFEKVAASPLTTSHASSSARRPMEDNLDFFAADVTTVLKDLRSDQFDPTVASMFHSKNRPTFAMTWTHEMWERHTSRMRFINSFLYWHQSALLKRVLPQLIGLMIWTCLATWIVESNSTFLSNIKFPMTSLSLVSGFVGSLLALRSNQGLSRLMEARMTFGKLVLYTRDMSSLVSHFVYPKNPYLGLKLARHLAIFGWLLKNYVRGQKVSGDDEDLIRTMLPTKADADYVLGQRKKPVAVVMRLRQALAALAENHQLGTADELAIDHVIQAMDQSIMLTERIVASPIPPLFTTHAGRLLVFYLFFLPLALQSSGNLNVIGTFVTVLAVGYAMLGLDEISHLMEQPFKLTPLYDLCKNSMQDVADSMCFRPPSLDDRNNDGYVVCDQPYWTNGNKNDLERGPQHRR